MAQYKLYAGLGGGFGGAQYQGTYEFADQSEADKAAYDLAVEEYESYGGMHGLLDWDGVYEDCLESGYLEGMTQAEAEQTVDEYYVEHMEGWLCYYAKEIDPILDWQGDDEDDWDYDDDDDGDCYCDD